jgi:restriction system protein
MGKKRQLLLESGIQHVDRMKERDFEVYLRALFRAHGYSAAAGRHLMLRQKGRKIVVQAKRCNENVSVSAVEEALDCKNECGADETWVVTNRDYTAEAYRLAARNGVRLINRERLLLLMIRANPQMLCNPADQEDVLLFHNYR